MSYQQAEEPVCSARAGVDLLIEPKEKSLGSFSVRRALPSRERRMVGPFIFFDEMGPAVLAPGVGIDVRPHPHIGIATITYLFSGEIMHRDSLGYVQAIEPGAVNLMTTGSGMTHSERSREATLDSERQLHGIQSWMALPEHAEETDPAFRHYPASDLPVTHVGDAEVRVILGEFDGTRSPVATLARILYLDVQLPVGASFTLPHQEDELGIYVVSGAATIGECDVPAHALAVLSPADAVITASQDTRLMVLGGEKLGERHIWWNFVSSSTARIDQAKADWQAGRFAMVPGDDEFIPLPE